jgi:heat shock protein HtpX
MEYQADATAAKITRDPEALARALEKIAEHPKVDAFNTGHLIGNMCIADPAGGGFFNYMSKLYSTHPPIEDRIVTLRKMMARGRAIS